MLIRVSDTNPSLMTGQIAVGYFGLQDLRQSLYPARRRPTRRTFESWPALVADGRPGAATIRPCNTLILP